MGTAEDLFGKTRASLLALLFSTPEKRFYTREILRMLDLGQGTVQRELENLLGTGLIKRERLGSQVFYQANKQSPVFAEMKSLVDKTIGVFGLLQKALQPITEKISVAFVYGSVARRTENAESDVDVMVIGAASLDLVLEVLGKVEKTLGRPLNPTVYSAAEFRQKVAMKNHFLVSVLNGPKEFLIGTEDELRKVGRKQLA